MDSESVLNYLKIRFPDSAVKVRKDSTTVKVNGENGVTFSITADQLRIGFPIIRWKGPYTSKAGIKLWNKAHIESLEEDSLALLVSDALKIREAELITCKHCKHKFISDRTIGGDCCHGCASKYEGIVF